MLNISNYLRSTNQNYYEIINAGKDAEKKGTLLTVLGGIDSITMENSTEVPQKTKNETTM